MKDLIHKAVTTLRAGGVICYPTDTIWGIGCDARNEEAVARVFEIKQRADGKALVTLVNSDAMLNRTVPDVPEVAWDLIDAADQPLTIIYDNVSGLAANLVAEDGSAAIRMVREGFCNQLVTAFGKPLVSTSANISGQAPPTGPTDIDPAILNAVDYALPLRDYGQGTGQASSIIKLGNGGEITIIRK